jgi:hypothetical protein
VGLGRYLGRAKALPRGRGMMSTVVDHLVGAAGLIEALALAWEAKGAGEFVSLSKAKHLKEVVSNGFSGRVLLSKVTRQWNCAVHCCYS